MSSSVESKPENIVNTILIDVGQWLREHHNISSGPEVSDPVEVSCYSVADGNVSELGSRSSLFTYRDPPAKARLGKHYRSFVDNGYEAVDVIPLVQFIPKLHLRNVDFICLEHCLEYLGSTPYNFRYPYTIEARYCSHGSIALAYTSFQESFETAENRRNNYYESSFRAYCTGTMTSKGVNGTIKFRSIVQRFIGDVNVVCAASVDAIDEGDEETEVGVGVNKSEKYLKLKTALYPVSKKQRIILWGTKLRRLWLQAFVVGMGSVVVGLREESGDLRKVERFATSQVPDIAKEKLEMWEARPWKPEVMLSFMEYVLTKIREVCVQNESCFVRVVYEPNHRAIKISVVDKVENGEKKK